jgi:hypothetical protein
LKPLADDREGGEYAKTHRRNTEYSKRHSHNSECSLRCFLNRLDETLSDAT